jgi:Gpi18-like mannosyltransferase
MKQLIPKHKLKFYSVVALLTGFVVFIRIIGLLFRESLDISGFIIPWYDTLAEKGFSAFAQPFSNYTPPYLYLLWLITATQALLPKAVAIKLLSIVFDIGNALMIYKILKINNPKNDTPYLGALLFLALPTVFLNSSFWGQADGIYTFFLLISIYFLLQECPSIAMIAFGVAFAFKAQAVFLTPFLLLLTINKRIPWYSYLLIPLVYLGMMTPAMIAGRPMGDLLGIYLNQAGTYHSLSMNAPNIYLLIPDTYYSDVVMIGAVAAGIIAVAWAVYYSQKISKPIAATLILCAAVSALMLPFFLPKMHERYFYLSDTLLFILAFYIPRFRFLSFISQIVSLLTYSVFLFLKYDTSAALIDSFLLTAILGNFSLVVFVLLTQYKLIPSMQSNGSVVDG